MNTTKTLLAASILAAAGAANATVIDSYTLNVSGITTGLASGSLSGSGTATLDDGVGTGGTASLTLHLTNVYNNQPAAGAAAGFTGPGAPTFYTDITTVFLGSISGDSFTNTLAGQFAVVTVAKGKSTTTYVPSGGTQQITHCTNGTIACPSALSTVPSNLTVWSATGSNAGGMLTLPFAIAEGGTAQTITNSVGTSVTNTVTYTFTNTAAPTVPVPAAAWLFGSGLLGLAGTARRRRNA